ncbi:DUF3515 domain-containing protein [Pseudonocardiaceae bacterium YIM PH 21723]|nr:DUF3515 domain-containing protein [Pseudonocardiaceae bacterium YIM PH 21723]
MAETNNTPPGLPKAVIAVAVALPLLLIAGILVARQHVAATSSTEDPAVVAARTGPLALPALPAPQEASAECGSLVGALPGQLISDGVTLPRRELAQPAPAGAAAWGDKDHDPVVLRCGLSRPEELNLTSKLVAVSGVSWLRLEGSGKVSWVVVDRPVYAALTAPVDSGTGPLQDLSAAVAKALPPTAVDGRTLPNQPPN